MATSPVGGLKYSSERTNLPIIPASTLCSEKNTHSRFLPRDAMLSAVYATVYLSVRLSVRPSVCHTRVLYQNG